VMRTTQKRLCGFVALLNEPELLVRQTRGRE
jgi:hypothetical protein